MNILFVHQNMPGQFKHLAPHLAQLGHRVAFLTKRTNLDLPGIERINYPAPDAPSPQVHGFARRYDAAVRFGQRAADRLAGLMREGFVPDVIIGHTGWGETLFLKQVCPTAKLIAFSEFFYRGKGADIGFDPASPPTRQMLYRSQARNAHLLLALDGADAIICPTRWQKSVHPAWLHDRITVLFEGIDTNAARPDPMASLTLEDGRILRAGDKVVTYVARNLEPYRGFPTFMRALPLIQARHPDADVLIVGGDEVSYGDKPTGHATWREAMMQEVAFDPSRVHWMGKLPYARYLSVLQVSAAHVYLTYPFVLSWSCFEALATGALVIASRTPPTREVIRDGTNGLFVDFFDPQAVADRVADVLDDPTRYAPLRDEARRSIEARYALPLCLARWTALIEQHAPRRPGRPRRVISLAGAPARDMFN